MWPFNKRKKKLYCVKWRYTQGVYLGPSFEYQDCVQAYDIADAWKRVRATHCNSISFIEAKEITE